MDWVEVETKNADFGDERLNKRYGKLLSALAGKPTSSIPQACNGWHETKAAYRFFDCADVTTDKVLKPHADACLDRIKNEEVVFLIQDTSELDYSKHMSKEGIGLLNAEHRKGLYLHPTIAVTPERLCLGVLDCQMIIREKLRESGRKLYKKEPIEKRESYRWIKGYQVALETALKVPDTLIVNICDREGDIFELFAEAHQASVENAKWIIRGNQNRLLSENSANSKSCRKLFEAAKGAEKLGEIRFNLPRTKTRKSRKVKQEIRSSSVVLKPPLSHKNRSEPVEINLVYCVEVGCPPGEKPIEWLLLTDISVTSKADALKIVEWYLCRWQVEIFFRVLKSGCKIEELRLENIERLLPCLALYMIIAWRVMYITMLGRACPDLRCDIFFDDAEWKSAYVVAHKKPPPKDPPSLNSIVRLIAEFGGFLNRKNDGYPGHQAIWIGLQRTRDFAIAWESFNAMTNETTYG